MPLTNATTSKRARGECSATSLIRRYRRERILPAFILFHNDPPDGVLRDGGPFFVFRIAFPACGN